jgi:hypothetical protein
MTPPILRWLPVLFPLIFLMMWLVITSLVGLLSGWFRLQSWYSDDGTDEVLFSTPALPGYMGRLGVRLSGWLTLGASRKGLSLRVFRLLAPFQRPLLIPWSEVQASPPIGGWFGGERVTLQFGEPPVGQLAITAQTWARLVGAADADSRVRE